MKRCTRCGWREGDPPLNCNNDDTPHRLKEEDENGNIWPDDFQGFGITVTWDNSRPSDGRSR